MSSEEKLQILQMIESKQITPEEGMHLLAAIDQPNPTPSPSDYYSAEFIRIRVVEGNSTKVNVNLPISLIEVFMDVGTKFLPQDVPEIKHLNFKKIITQVKAGARGKLVQIDDGDTFVEVSVE